MEHHSVIQKKQLLIDAIRDEPQKHAKQKKPDTKGHTSYDSSIWNIQKGQTEAKSILGVACS